MPERVLRIRGRDSLLFRDGRPFAAELGALTAQSLPLPLPGTLAGMLRTRLGDAAGWNWRTDGPDKARATAVVGPLLCGNGQPVYPAPADALLYGDEKSPKVMTLRPYTPPSGAGCDLPDGLLPIEITETMKPLGGYRFWPQDAMTKWLAGEDGTPPKIVGLPAEERTHTAMCYETGAGDEGKLFHTSLVTFEEHEWEALGKKTEAEWSLLARLTTDETRPLAGATPFGGERRLAQVEDVMAPAAWPACPPEVATALTGRNRIRLVLATPALFRNGWKPGWLGAGLSGQFQGMTMTLKAAAVGRREPVSGWDLERRRPKPVRWMVPAGSVYFFEVDGEAAALANACWLEPVSDEAKDRRDGYGLALWGFWES